MATRSTCCIVWLGWGSEANALQVGSGSQGSDNLSIADRQLEIDNRDRDARPLVGSRRVFPWRNPRISFLRRWPESAVALGLQGGRVGQD